jgi:carboxyl-terminal processing protease
MVMQSGITSYFVFEQLDKERKQFTGLPADLITEKVTKDDKYFKAFNAYLLNNGLVFKLEPHKDKVKRYLAAEFARQVLSEKDYYEMILKEDNMVKAVLEK